MFDLEIAGQKLEEMNAVVPFRQNVPERAMRWKKYFSDWEHQDKRSGEKVEHLNDLKHDPVLRQRHEGALGQGEMNARRYLTEMVLDNCVNEAKALIGARLRRGPLMEASTISTSDIAAFTRWSLPLIRKIWPRLFAWEIVGVQGMPTPTGKAFTLDFQYASSGGTYTSGTSIYANEDADYSDDPGEASSSIKKLKLALTGTDITASAKKLITDWSIESQQDLNAYHQLSLEGEMMKILGMQIEREKNREIIDGVAAAATTNTNWTSTQPTGTNPWANQSPKEYAETLWDSICDANKQIYDRIYQDANVILCGSTFANRLTKLNGFRAVDTSKAGDANVMTGPNLFGSLNTQYRLYKDPYFTADKAIVIHKNPNWLYTGYVHCPYVPVWISPTIAETNFTFAKGMMSRYANFAKNGDFFATVTVV